MTVDLAQLGPKFNTHFRASMAGSPEQVGATPRLQTIMKDLGNFLGGVGSGFPATALLELSVQPTTGDTVTIGTDVYEFVTAAGSVADDAYIGVPIGGAVAATRTSFINAINGDVAAATGLTMTDGVTPAERNGTLDWLASLVDTTYVRIQSADAVGGAVESRADTTVVAETLTNAANIWDVGTGNAVATGADPSQTNIAMATKTITADMITFGSTRFSFAAPAGGAQGVGAFIAQVRTTTGAVKDGYTDTFVVNDADVEVTFIGGGTDIVATDVVTIVAAR